MKDIELPPLSKFDHPEPRTMQWSDLELYAIKSYAIAAVESDRAQRVPDVEALKDHLVAISSAVANSDDRVAQALIRTTLALLASTPAPAQQEPSEAEMVCAEAYQVVGCLLSDLGLFETEAARKILDNLSEARMVHQDVLPWESAQHQEQPQQEKCPSCRTGSIYACTCPFPTARNQEPPQQERKPMTEQERHALFAGLLSETADKPTEMFRLIVERVERHHGIRKD